MRAVGIATLIVIASALGACKSEDKAACKEVKPGEITTVNAMCVVMNEDPVDPALEPAEWKGQKVGFCCAGCKPDWEKMTPAEKDAALAKVASKK